MADTQTRPVSSILKLNPEKDFELLTKIGGGTYGEVYKAIEKSTGRTAAVKIVRLTSEEDDINIILQEIVLMQALFHPNIVRFLNSYQKRNKLWIAMEFCGEGSLQDIYRVTGSLTENQIGAVVTETLKGLEYLHNQRKIHRDIKGANILITSEGDIKLADFGISAQISESMSKRSTYIGTPYWMAPEVAAVEKTGGYVESCDIWSVGITAIELAELKPPLYDLHPMCALKEIARSHYKPPGLKNSKLWSPHFNDFVKQALTKDPRGRPTATMLLMHHFCKTRPVQQLMKALIDKKVERNRLNEYLSAVPSDEDEFPGEERTLKQSTVMSRIKSASELHPQETSISELVVPTAPVLDSGPSNSPPKSVLKPQTPGVTPVAADENVSPKTRPYSVFVPSAVNDINMRPRHQSDAQKKPLLPPIIPERSEQHLPKMTSVEWCSEECSDQTPNLRFTRVFSGCPMLVFHAVSWIHPITKENYIIFGTSDGIYYSNIENVDNTEMILIYHKMCSWLHIRDNVLVAITGQPTNLTAHELKNLVEVSQENHVPPSGVCQTTRKINDTLGVTHCCTASIPSRMSDFLCAALPQKVLVFSWYSPLRRYMLVKTVIMQQPVHFSMFEPVVYPDSELPVICTSVAQRLDGKMALSTLDLNSTSKFYNIDQPLEKEIGIVHFSQIHERLLSLSTKDVLHLINPEGDILYSMDMGCCISGVVYTRSAILGIHDQGVVVIHKINLQIASRIVLSSKKLRLLGKEGLIVLEIKEPRSDTSNILVLTN